MQTLPEVRFRTREDEVEVRSFAVRFDDLDDMRIFQDLDLFEVVLFQLKLNWRLPLEFFPSKPSCLSSYLQAESVAVISE